MAQLKPKDFQPLKVKTFTSRDPDLKDLIRRVAARMGRSPEEIAITMNFFFEGIANIMLDGKSVTIPGFGLFGTRAFDRKNMRSPHIMRRTYPAFCGSHDLRRSVTLMVSPERASLQGKKFLNFRSNTTRFGKGHGKDAPPDLGEVNRKYRRRQRRAGAALGIIIPEE